MFQTPVSQSSGLMRERHNSILERIVIATRSSQGIKFRECKIPGDLRPDLALIDRPQAVVDVIIPFLRKTLQESSAHHMQSKALQ